MTELVHHVDIDRAPELLFEVATDPTRFAQWQASGRRGWCPVARGWAERDGCDLCLYPANREIRSGPDAAGERNDPPRRWAAVALDGPIRANATAAVESLAHGTRSRVTFTLDFQGPGIGG